MPYTFAPQAAVDITTGELGGQGVSGSVYATESDAQAEINPLTVTVAGGVSTTTITVSSIGQTQEFTADPPQVWWRSGAIIVHLMAFEEILAGFQSAVRSVNGITPGEDGDVQVVASGTDDAGIGELIGDSESATYAALTERYGLGFALLDLDDPSTGIPDGIIILRTAGGGTPPPVPVVYAQDDFERTVAPGSLGTASGGGSYEIGVASDWSVGLGAARWISPAAGNNGGYAILSTYSQSNVEIIGAVSQESGDVGNRYITISPRRNPGASGVYGANLVLRGPAASRPLQVDLGLQKGPNTGDLQPLVGSVLTTGALGDLVRFRVRVEQVDPATTRVRARIWLDGNAEPSTWQMDATDTTADMQTAGSLQIDIRQNTPETVASEARIHEFTVQSVIDA